MSFTEKIFTSFAESSAAFVAVSFVPIRLMSPAFVVMLRSSPAVNSELIL